MTSRRDLLGAALGAPLAATVATAADPDCVFCSIVAGSAPAVVVRRDAHTIAFGALHPRMPGHVLLAPIEHVVDVYGVRAPLAGQLFETAADLARAMKRVLRADGLTLLQNNERAGDQTVFHLHLHLIPRYAGRPLWAPAVDPVEVSLQERERILAPLRDALK